LKDQLSFRQLKDLKKCLIHLKWMESCLDLTQLLMLEAISFQMVQETFVLQELFTHFLNLSWAATL